MASFDYEWNEAKRAANLAKHGVDFLAVYRFDWTGAWSMGDSRHDYGENRFIAYSMLDGRLHVVIFTQRGGTRRIISLRKANLREQAAFEARTRRRG